MSKRNPRCRYKGKVCRIDRDMGQEVLLVTTNEFWAEADGGWERMDKFEWEKVVPKDEVTILPSDDAT